MTPFLWIFTGHIFGDFFLQTGREGLGKANNLFLCSTHAFKWTLGVALGALAAGWRFETGFLVALVLAGIFHAIIDRRWVPVLLLRLREYIPMGDLNLAKREAEEGEKYPYPEWLVILVDQALHWFQVAILTVWFEVTLPHAVPLQTIIQNALFG